MDIYYFTDKFEKSEIQSLNKKIHIIYRNYSKGDHELTIKKLVRFCKNNNRKIFISNEVNLAIKYNFDGLYIPAFNKFEYSHKFKKKTNFKIIGSAHNYQEILIKEKQGCEEIFISPIFKTPKHKNHLDTIKFNMLSANIKNKVVALGGINSSNFFKIRLTKSKGFASISWIKKNGLNKI